MPRERTDRRTMILDAASALFAEHGFAGTTIRDIAKDAEMTSGSLYHHFTSKEAMLAEVLHGFLDDLVSRWEQIERAETGVLDTLRDLVRDGFRTIHEHGDAVALYQQEARGLVGHPDFAFVEGASARLEGVIRRTVATGKAEGVLRADLDEGLAYRFVRDMVWASVHWYDPHGPRAHQELADRYLAVLLGGLSTR